MKTTFGTTVIAFIVTLCLSTAAFGQYSMKQTQMMQRFNAQNNRMMNYAMNLYRHQQQKHQQKLHQLVKQYRKETGDTQSTDQANYSKNDSRIETSVSSTMGSHRPTSVEDESRSIQ